VVHADGSGLRRVTSTGREYPAPDYLPSGRAIASGRFEFPELPQWTLR
jgi:hypothetical protein